MASVVGTDVPAAALVVAALALLVVLAPRRPWTAAVVFGVTMGLAAWIRAVALPLTALSIGVWLARRERFVRALLLTGASVAATLAVLAPWGIRHVRESGALYFTDDHGGVTALIGANPNSEGTYTRALNRMFNDVTGRSVLAEPHHETDQIAYGIVREWWRYEPGLCAGAGGHEGRAPVRSRGPSLLLADVPPRRAGGARRGPRRRAPRGAGRGRPRVRAGGAGSGAVRHGHRGHPAPLGVAGAAPVPALAGRDVHDLLRGAALSAADRDAGLPVRRAGAGRVAALRHRGRAAGAGREQAFAAGAAGGRRHRAGLVGRVAAGRRRRTDLARAPPVGRDGGRAERPSRGHGCCCGGLRPRLGRPRR